MMYKYYYRDIQVTQSKVFRFFPNFDCEPSAKKHHYLKADAQKLLSLIVKLLSLNDKCSRISTSYRDTRR